MVDKTNHPDPGGGPGPIAALRSFYRDRPVAFALALIAVSTLCLITGIWMLPG